MKAENNTLIFDEGEAVIVDGCLIIKEGVKDADKRIEQETEVGDREVH